ncbi:MAG TPA: CoA transferase, partial [Acetobacteraceae bacterium]
MAGVDAQGTGPLAGVRVAEIGTGAALDYCGKLFADFGADVVKIEPPGGDPERAIPPLVETAPGHRESAVFAWRNTNKRSVVADASMLREVIAHADVLLDARGPDADHEALRAAHPGLHIVSLSWFGESGPYRDFRGADSVVRALAGLVKLTGPIDEPAMQGEHQSGVPAALAGFNAAMGALLSGGPGRRFEISIHEANVVIGEYQAGTAVGMGIDERRRGVNRWFPTFPLGIHPCREGWLGITVLTADQWRNFCDMLGMHEQAADPRYATAAERIPHAEPLEAIYLPRLRERTAKEWFAEGLRRRIPFVVVPSMADLLAEPVHRSRGAFGTVAMGHATFEAPVLPQRLSRTRPSASGAAPLAGEHTASWRAAPAVLKATEPKRALPLDGVRIVDMAMGWAGPLCTRQMADLGAEIIKVEGRAYPDWWRGADYSEAGISDHVHEKRLWFNELNRNKTGITLDLTQPDGAGLLKRLVATADAVVENYSQGVLPKLGLAYPDLLRVKPDLVMVSMPAFAAGTDWAEVRAYGSTLEQGSGLPSVTGREGWPPTMNHIAYGDPIGGLNAAAALLVALMHRKRTGEGQLVDLSQVECMFPLVAPWIIEQSVNGRVGPRLGNRHPVFVPHGCFRCAGEDGWVVVAVTDDAAFAALCQAIGRPDLGADPALATAEGRRAQEDRLEAAITAWTRERSPDQAMTELQAAGVAAGVARSFTELMLREPHLEARGFWQEIDRPFMGRHRQPSPTWREDGRYYPVRMPAPTLG